MDSNNDLQIENFVISDFSDNLEDYMRAFGEKGKHVLVRYDPERAEKHFTILINNIRLIDTDYPTLFLKTYLFNSHDQSPP